jgi:parallel beta-helix repeat protein
VRLTTYPQAGAWSRRKAQYRWRVVLAGLAAFAAVALTMTTLPVFAEGETTGSLTLSGASGTYLTAGSFSHGSNDLEVRFYAAADNWGSGTQTLLSRWPGASQDNAVRVQFTSQGHLQLLVKDADRNDVVFTGSRATLGLNNGEGRWFRVVLDIDDGSGASVARFWASGDPADTASGSVNWGSAADTDTESAISGLTDSDGAWEIGSRKGGTADVFAGSLAVVELYRNGAAGSGTKAIDLDFRDEDQSNAAHDKWTDGTGTTWTAVGGGWSYEPPETTTTTTEPPTTTPPVDPDDDSNDVTQLSPGTPVDDDTGAMVLPGTGGNYVRGTSFGHGSGDIDFIFRAAADDWSRGSTQTVLARWAGTSAATNAIRVQFKGDGTLQLLVKTSSGSDLVYTITANQLGGLQDGKAYWFRIKFNAQSTNGSNARFWVTGASASQNPLGLAWGSAVRSRRSQSAVPANASSAWEIGSRNTGGRDTFDGKLMYVSVYRDGWADNGGAKIVELDMRDDDQASADHRTWTDGAGTTWQMVGSGSTYEGGTNPPAPNADPVAVNDSLATTKDDPASFTKSQLLANDSDPDGDALTVASIATGSARGGSIAGSGSTYSYSPPSGFVGSDSFVYTLSDTQGNTTIGTVDVTVQDDPDTGAYDVVVRPGDDLQALVNSNPSGTSFYLKAGLYRRLSVQPKAGNTFVGESGAVLTGSKRLTDWSSDGGDWVATGQTQGSSSPSQGTEWGYCDDGYSGCVYPEDVFIDGNRQWRVTSRSAVEPGKWYFDYGADRIYIGTNPSGKNVETSVDRHAFWGSSDNVTITGFTIQMYASPGRQGAVNPRIGRAGAAGTGWTVTDNVIRKNHGIGVKSESGMVVKNNYIGDNGQGGFVGTGNNILVQGNEFDRNCTAGYKCFGFEGGAIKLSTRNTTIRNNFIHDDLGNGIHTDIQSSNIVIEGNVVRDNRGAGISHEISGSAVIRNNVVDGNGFKPTGQREPGIIVISSSDVEVYGNTLSGNGNSILARQDSRTSEGQLRDLWVHDNHMTLFGQERVGINVSISDNSYYTTKNNRFDHNTYAMGNSQTSVPFVWMRANYTIQQWKNAGNDTHGTFQ